MKPSEVRLLSLLGALAALCGGAIMSQSLLNKQRDLSRRAQALELKQMEANGVLAEAELWKARYEWLLAHQPAMTSGSQASQELLDELQEAASQHNLVVQKKQLHEATRHTYYHEVGVTLTLQGDIPDFFRWLHSMLSPESFRMVSLLKIVPDTQDKSKIVFTVRMNRRHAPELAAAAAASSADPAAKEGGQ